MHGNRGIKAFSLLAMNRLPAEVKAAFEHGQFIAKLSQRTSNFISLHGLHFGGIRNKALKGLEG